MKLKTILLSFSMIFVFGCALRMLTPDEKILQNATTIQIGFRAFTRVSLFAINKYSPQFVGAAKDEFNSVESKLRMLANTSEINISGISAIIGSLFSVISQMTQFVPDDIQEQITDAIQDVGDLADAFIAITTNPEHLKIYATAIADGIQSAMLAFERGEI